MTKKDLSRRRGRGRPAKGNVKVTFKLAPRIAAALEKAREMTGKGKSQLVEAALIAYLHLSVEES
jgi:Ribbon-helix-helix protein, copG family